VRASRLIVRKRHETSSGPRAETLTHWITMGTDTSLAVATKTAIRAGMLLASQADQ